MSDLHNDIIVFLKMQKDHLVWLWAVFKKLKEVGLKLKPSKCDFLKKWCTYFEHKISDRGIEPDDSKIKVICEWPTPKKSPRLDSF